MVGTGCPGPGAGWNGASWVAPGGNGYVQAAFRYTALASTRRVAGLVAPGGIRPVIFPAVCSAIRSLICCRAGPAAWMKSAARSWAHAAWASAAVKSGCSASPDCTQTVFGARSVRSPAARLSSRAHVCSRPAAASCGLARRSVAASCAAVSPRAPSSVIRSAVPMLAGEKTRLPAPPSAAYRPAPNRSAGAGLTTSLAMDAGRQPGDRVPEHLVLLAERESYLAAAGCLVVVEHRAGDGHHTGLAGQPAAEIHPVGLAERPDIRGHEVGAGRLVHLEPHLGQAGAEQVALAPQVPADRGEVGV